ncbi:MAG TPA: PD-(D/E)XK nuclease family protein [Terriglobia bacterium]|nr:PD-(D/E)XK nuclease family protein [Terriglobia bacterium]
MIRILVCPAAEDRLAAAADFLNRSSSSTERLLIGASREAVDRFAHGLAVQRKATFGLHRFTLTQLAAHLATPDFARRGVAHSTPLASEAVAARSVFEALGEGGLDYFKPVTRMPGFARALGSTLNELRLAGIRPAEIHALAADDGSTGAHDLARLLQIYAAQADQASVADRAALFLAATRALRDEAKSRFEHWPMLFLDVALASAAEQEFLHTLVGTANDVLITVPAGDERTQAALHSLPGSESAPAPDGGHDSGLQRLRSYLFSPEGPDPSDADGEVCFFSAPGEGRECLEIARRILGESRQGVAFDQTAVLLRAASKYAALLETALARAGIPAYFTRGSQRPDPSGRAFLAVLACAAENLSAARFAEYLSLGQVPPLDENGAPVPANVPWARPGDEGLGPAAVLLENEVEDGAGNAASENTDIGEDAPALQGTLRAPWKWERLLVEAAVIGGKDRWARRIDGLESEWKLKLASLGQEEPDSARARGVKRDLNQLAHLRAFAMPIIERLAGLPPQAAWGEWLEHLKHLAPVVLRRPERVLGLLAELEPMDRVGPVMLAEVWSVLEDRLATLDPERPRRDYGCVFVGTPDQARGRSFEVVFVPGLAERIFPQRVSEDPILLDELRQQLGHGLRLQDDRVESERLQLKLAAGAARKRIYISYPRLEVAKSRQRVPSFYALDVRRATRGKIPRFEDLESEARREAAAALDWPAPDDPACAIDDVEHDLAVLGPMLRHPSDDSLKGRARYLLELNDHLARSLRARWHRWARKWSESDGLCEPGTAVVEALARDRLTARPYSASALQRYAQCPYQFLLSAIHKLEPREESVPLVQMDPLTRGSIFHRVQADFMRRLQQSGGLPVTLDNLGQAQLVLDETLATVAEEQRDKLAPAILQVWRDGIDGIRTDLRGWLQRMAETPAEWLPVHFEFGIGFAPEEGRDPASLKDPVILAGGYQFHGYVDLIERRANGRELRVTDYKTGQNRTQDGMVIGGGEVLQPVLYGLAVETALHENVSEGRLYFCTSVGGFRDRPVTLHDVARLRGLQVLQTVDRALERPFLAPAPKQGACSRCDFLLVCGPMEERRLAEKDPDALDDLNTLRGLP